MEVVYFVTQEWKKNDPGLQALLIEEPSERVKTPPGSRQDGGTRGAGWGSQGWGWGGWSGSDRPAQLHRDLSTGLREESEKLGSVCGLGQGTCGGQRARRVRSSRAGQPHPSTERLPATTAWFFCPFRTLRVWTDVKTFSLIIGT